MKSLLFSALAIIALTVSGCATQSGGTQNLCGQPTPSECMVLSGDCNCGSPQGLCQFGGLLNCKDKRGMGMCINGKGTACDQGKNNGLFSRGKKAQACGDCGDNSCGCESPRKLGSKIKMKFSDGGCGCDTTAAPAAGCGCESAAPAASGCGCDTAPAAAAASDCGCDAAPAAAVSMSDCGCETEASCGDAPASRGTLLASLQSKGCFTGKCGLGKCGLGLCGKKDAGCSDGSCALGGKLGGKLGGCGVPGCGSGGKMCGGCMSKLQGAGQHPYGGMIPHTAQVPGAGTGMAPAYAYPYYTTRGPRDFLMKKPPSIGY